MHCASPQTWRLFSFPRACANYPKSIEQGTKSFIFKAVFRRSCTEQGEDGSTDSTCHSTASEKTDTGLAGIMLIALLQLKKSICRQSARSSFIKAGIHCDWREALSSVHFTLMNWKDESLEMYAYTQAHTEIVKILGKDKQHLGVFNKNCYKYRLHQESYTTKFSDKLWCLEYKFLCVLKIRYCWHATDVKGSS